MRPTSPDIDPKLLDEMQIETEPLVRLFHALYEKYGSDAADGIIVGLYYSKEQLESERAVKN